MFKKILVPLDGSKTAEKVITFAIDEASAHGAILILLRVIPPLRSSFMVAPKFVEQLAKQAHEMALNYLTEKAAMIKEAGVEVKIKIRSGQPAVAILEYAKENACDLVIIGTRGETNAMQWRFGGTANKLIKSYTTFPVLVVSTD